MSKFISANKKRNKYTFDLPNEFNESVNELHEAKENSSGKEESSYIEYVAPYDEYETITKAKEDNKKQKNNKKNMFFTKYLLAASLAVVMVTEAALPSGSSPFDSSYSEIPGIIDEIPENNNVSTDKPSLSALIPYMKDVYEMMKTHSDISIAKYIRKNTDALKAAMPDMSDSANFQEIDLTKDNKLVYREDIWFDNDARNDIIMRIKLGYMESSHYKGERILTFWFYISDNVFAETQTNMFSFTFDDEYVRYAISDSITYNGVYSNFIYGNYGISADGTIDPYRRNEGQVINGYIDGRMIESDYQRRISDDAVTSMEMIPRIRDVYLYLSRNNLDYRLVEDQLVDLRGNTAISDYYSNSAYFLENYDDEYAIAYNRDNPNRIDFMVRNHYYTDAQGVSVYFLDDNGQVISYQGISHMFWGASYR